MLKITEKENKVVSAVIVSAGNSTRMGGINKQFLELDGAPVIVNTITMFQRCNVIDEIIIVTRECDIDNIKKLISYYNFKKVSTVVKGGETRQLSVYNGVINTSKNSEYVAIHDGARPLITKDDIKSVVERAYVTKAATLGTPVTDTIKVVDVDVIVSTPQRDTLRAVQTPQVFERELYLKAIDNMEKNNLSVTDDCSMVEALPYDVTVVSGSPENIKLTTRTDLIFAEAILKNRGYNS
jgi:2-C-methyl-D-erythritol 4-phosphate cytidylyltransferase